MLQLVLNEKGFTSTREIQAIRPLAAKLSYRAQKSDGGLCVTVEEDNGEFASSKAPQPPGASHTTQESCERALVEKEVSSLAAVTSRACNIHGESECRCGKMERKYESEALKISDFKEMVKLFTVLDPKPFECPDAEEKMLELTCFYSEDVAKLEEVVDEFHSFHTLWIAVLPFLIANDMDPVYPHMVILHRLYKTLSIRSARTEVSVL
ncbi:hypothetical protein MHYP_G00204140 [Metynnis hypsauchen]